MPVEHDDEATTFDPKPWGAMQRVMPSARFTAGALADAAIAIRTSGPLQSSSVAAIVPIAGPRFPVPPLPSRMPAATPHAPLVTVTPATHGSFAPSPPAARSTIPLAELPLTVFGADVDCTLRVRRRPLTARSLIAVPLGAVLAAIVIILGTSGSSSSPSVNVRTSIARHTAPMLLPSSADLAASNMTAGVDARLEAEPPPALIAASALPTISAHATAPVPAPKRVVSKRASSGRPRKIIAVDASTPLGNLRPRRF